MIMVIPLEVAVMVLLLFQDSDQMRQELTFVFVKREMLLACLIMALLT